MFKGQKHTEETKRKLSLRRGWHHTPEAIEKIRQAGKRRVGTKLTEEHKKNISIAKRGQNVGEKNWIWKGDSVGYRALHYWLINKVGKASYCSNNITHKAKRFEWANISGEYKRDESDFIQLCPSCHRKYDWIKMQQ